MRSLGEEKGCCAIGGQRLDKGCFLMVSEVSQLSVVSDAHTQLDLEILRVCSVRCHV